MISSKNALSTALLDWFNSNDVKPTKHIDLIASAALSGVGFIRAKQNPELGGTRLGGTPDLPPGMAWPIREALENKQAAIEAGGPTHKEHLERYASESFPFEFIAQINCTEAAEHLADTLLLPDTGRLLFFYDSMLGPWRNGTASCRVIWDDSAADKLVRAPAPTAFEQMREREEKNLLSGPNIYNLSKEELLNCVPQFISPAQSISAIKSYRILDYHSLEYYRNKVLERITLTQDDEEYDYGEFATEFNEHITESLSRHQMFGVPCAEQDDPRYDAVSLTDTRIQERRLKGEEWPSLFKDIEKLAADWQLLLQVDLSELEQDDMTEGTLYFLLHKNDMTTCQFDNVVAVYQQT